MKINPIDEIITCKPKERCAEVFAVLTSRNETICIRTENNWEGIDIPKFINTENYIKNKIRFEYTILFRRRRRDKFASGRNFTHPKTCGYSNPDSKRAREAIHEYNKKINGIKPKRLIDVFGGLKHGK